MFGFSLISMAVTLLLAQMTEASKFGVLIVKTDGLEDKEMCIKYYPELYNLTATTDSAHKYSMSNVEDLTGVETCQDNQELGQLDDKVVIVSSTNSTGNCSIANMTKILEAHHASGVMADGTVSGSFNASFYSKTNILVLSLFDPVDKKQVLDIKAKYPSSKFIVYGPEMAPRKVDGSIFLIFFMAIFTISLGSLWSGYTRYHMLQQHNSGQRQNRIPTQDTSGQNSGTHESNADNQVEESDNNSGERDEDSLNGKNNQNYEFSTTTIIFFVFCMCTMLLCLYFFYDYLVYIMIGMFMFATTFSTYACFEPIIMWSYQYGPAINLPTCTFPLGLGILKMELRQLVLFTFSVSMSIIWAVYRNESWAWVLQDILGILFSINMLRVIHFPSYKSCVVLLSILFFYDIFFVFITPLFTEDGSSIMVEVATGGKSGEQLPMVLKVPRLSYNPLSSCWIPYSMLGYGDILVPGLLLSYCHAFDIYKRTPFKAYWLTSNIFYALGLKVTFVALFLMEEAQPALLYLVPFTLIPTALLASIRGELQEFWKGGNKPQRVVIDQSKVNN